jgi:hypothetical protein
VVAGAQLDPRSGELIRTLLGTVDSEQSTRTGPWINTTSYGIPVYSVPSDQPTVAVRLTPAANPALSAAWRAVPLPASAHPAAGADHTLVLSQPSTDRLWEFWHLQHSSGGWQAAWGGAIQHVSTFSGAFGPSAWPGAQGWWGASASSLSLAGGLISLEDLAHGEIDHALAMAIPAARSGAWASPAQRTDGSSSSPLSLPEGARLRLDPTLDLASLHLAPLTLVLARAAQRYGIFVTDTSPIVEFYAQDPTPTGADPYAGADGYFGGLAPNQLLASFPWDRLQVLRMELSSG